jgi:hypothetical protein
MTPEHSTRFRRAAAAEFERLNKARARALKAVAAAEQALRKSQAELEAIEDRLALLRSISGTTDEAPEPVVVATTGSGKTAILAGAAIRETAVHLLVDEAHRGPIHYRQWFARLQEAGYEVSGKRPEAVFLSQISRSPVVRATTENGVYEIDRDAPQRLEGELRRLEADLRRLTEEPPRPQELGKRRERQDELTTQIRHRHKQLEEALRVLEMNAPEAQAA